LILLRLLLPVFFLILAFIGAMFSAKIFIFIWRLFF
jgi:hypothetical protein